MIDRDLLREAILARLSSAVDPETGADAVRMRLIEDLAVDEASVVYYVPPLFPTVSSAGPLALSIRQAVMEIEGVTARRSR
jgi:metal-sulfur cluster biosynthetic enzyme